MQHIHAARAAKSPQRRCLKMRWRVGENNKSAECRIANPPHCRMINGGETIIPGSGYEEGVRVHFPINRWSSNGHCVLSFRSPFSGLNLVRKGKGGPPSPPLPIFRTLSTKGAIHAVSNPAASNTVDKMWWLTLTGMNPVVPFGPIVLLLLWLLCIDCHPIARWLMRCVYNSDRRIVPPLSSCQSVPRKLDHAYLQTHTHTPFSYHSLFRSFTCIVEDKNDLFILSVEDNNNNTSSNDQVRRGEDL